MSGDDNRKPENDKVDDPEQEAPAHTANGEETDDDEDANINNIHAYACLQAPDPWRGYELRGIAWWG